MDIIKALQKNITKPIYEITKVVTRVFGDSLSGKYFTINSANNTVPYYVWYNLDSASYNPSVGTPGFTKVLPRGDTGAVITLASRYMSFGVGKGITKSDTASLFYIWYRIPNNVKSYDPKVGKCEISTITFRGDTSDNLRRKYFRITMSTTAGDTRFIVFKKLIADTVSNMCVTGKIIPVLYTTNQSAVGIANDVCNTLNGYLGKINVMCSSKTGVISITNSTIGNVQDAIDGNVGGAFAVSVTDGVAAVTGLASKTGIPIEIKAGDTLRGITGKTISQINKGDTRLFYASRGTFVGDSFFYVRAKYGATVVAASAENSAFTVSTTQTSVAPVVGLLAKTAIPVVVATGDTDGMVAQKTKIALDAMTASRYTFTTTRQGDTLTIFNRLGGNTTASANVTAPALFKIVRNKQGDSGLTSMLVSIAPNLTANNTGGDTRMFYYIPSPTEIAYIRHIEIGVGGDTAFRNANMLGKRTAFTNGMWFRFMSGYKTSGDTQKAAIGPIKNSGDLNLLTDLIMTNQYHWDLEESYGEEIALVGSKGDYLRVDFGDTSSKLDYLKMQIEGKVKSI